MTTKNTKIRIAITCDLNRLGCKLLIKLIHLLGAEAVLIPVCIDGSIVDTLDSESKIDAFKQEELKRIESTLESVDAVIIPGNKYDVPPEWYQEKEVHEKTNICDDPYSFRLEAELQMAKVVMERKLPFLGICGGMHIFNTYLKGRLTQHLADDERNREYGIDHIDPCFQQKPEATQEELKENFIEQFKEGKNPKIFAATHPMSVCPHSQLAKLYQTHDKNIDLASVEELSIHHQGCFKEDLSPELQAVAFAPDGVVEAAEMPSHPTMFLLTQYHIEYNAGHIAKITIQKLIEAAEENKNVASIEYMI